MKAPLLLIIEGFFMASVSSCWLVLFLYKSIVPLKLARCFVTVQAGYAL
jgi:hypothetical protein